MFGINQSSKPTKDRSWVFFGLLVLVIWCMAMAAIRSDTITEYPPGCSPLHDLGFDIIPFLGNVIWPTTTFYATIADVWLMSTYVVFIFIIIPFCCKIPWTLKTRFALCLILIYTLRTITLLCTRYPKIPGFYDAYTPPNTALGAVLVIFTIRTTQTDFMFSGHASVWILMALFFWHYRKDTHVGFTWFAVFLWLSNITGIILLIGVRTHYTSDVIVGIAITALTFTSYHLVVNPKEMYITRLIWYLEQGNPK